MYCLSILYLIQIIIIIYNVFNMYFTNTRIFYLNGRDNGYNNDNNNTPPFKPIEIVEWGQYINIENI
jgi:hypothetical protein